MTMVERVARAIWNIRREEEDRCDMDLEDMGEDHSVWVEARSAIAAMREPTKHMLVATEDVVTGYDDFAVSDGTLYLSYGGVNGRDGFYDYAIAAHHAMIDAALKETA